MKFLVIVSCIAFSQQLSLATEITVGETRLNLPSPEGFAPITSSMKPFAEVAKRFVPPTNEQFALFLPEADVAIAATGGMPESARRFYVQTARDMINPFYSKADFLEIKRTIKTQNEEILKMAEAKMPDVFKKINQGISDDYKVDLNLAMTQMLPLPPHYETERALAYSMILRYNVNDEQGKPAVFEGIVTATFVYLQGKILFLYANAEKSGLEWSRAEARKWADSVIAANPSIDAVAMREARQARSVFDWGNVAEKALVGAVIGAIVGLLGYFLRKKKV